MKIGFIGCGNMATAMLKGILKSGEVEASDMIASAKSDHTREYVPFLVYGSEIKPGVNLHTRYSFATIADTVCKALDVDYCAAGCGVYDEICK